MKVSCFGVWLAVASLTASVENVDAFMTAPGGSKVALAPSSSNHKRSHHHQDALFSTAHTSNLQEGDEEDPHARVSISGKRQTLQRRVVGVTLAVLAGGMASNTWITTADRSSSNSIMTPPAAFAMGPNLLAPQRDQDQGKTAQQFEDDIRQKVLRNRFQKELAYVEEESQRLIEDQGPAAVTEFKERHANESREKREQREIKREALCRKLLLELYINPWTSLRGKAILFHFDYGVDLYKEDGTLQYGFETMKKRMPEKYGDVERRQQQMTKDDVTQLREEENMSDDEIMAKFEEEGTTDMTERQMAKHDLEVMRKRRKEYHQKKRDEKEAKLQLKLQKQQEKLNKNNNGAVEEQQQSLSPTTDDTAIELPDESTDLNTDTANSDGQSVAIAATTSTTVMNTEANNKDADIAKQEKEQLKVEKAKAKEETRAEKQRLKDDSKRQKAEAKALKQQAKTDAKGAKIAASAALAASVAAGSATASIVSGAAAVAAPTSAAMEQIATTESSPSSITASTTPDIGDDSAIDATSTTTPKSTDMEEGREDTTTESPVSTDGTDSAVTANTNDKKTSIPIVPAAAVLTVGGGGAITFKFIQDKSKKDEEERQRQFKLIMGLDEDPTGQSPVGLNGDTSNTATMDLDDLTTDAPSSSSTASATTTPPPMATPPPPAAAATTPVPPVATKKKKMGLGSIFAKKSTSSRETHLPNLLAADAPYAEFCGLLAQTMTYGAPGRFPAVSTASVDSAFLTDGIFQQDTARAAIIEMRQTIDITPESAAELFATVVNCMIIDIVDLASSSLKMKDSDSSGDSTTVSALNVVMNFMDHAAGIFDAVAEGVVISPVTYCGSLSKSKLEKMYGIYTGSLMSSMMASDNEGGTTQDRVDTLQVVFNINDKKAEGIGQKVMMKSLMSAMKDGGGEGGGMEGLAEMMGAMGGEAGAGMPDGMPGFGGDPNQELSPEEIKQSVGMMKELVESGTITKDEVALVKKQFQEAYGADITDLIAAADSGEMGDDLGQDGKDLLDLFKTVLGDDE